MSIRVLTFNVRLSWGEVGKPDEWKNRKDFCADIIRQGAFDFAGLQEVTWCPDRPELHQFRDLRNALPEYGFLGRSRAASPPTTTRFRRYLRNHRPLMVNENGTPNTPPNNSSFIRFLAFFAG